MQNALLTTLNWATDVDLGVNPDKTEMAIFSRKHTTPNIVIRGTPINISEEAKYLRLILDRKLSWKRSCQERARKETIADDVAITISVRYIDTCKNAIGKRWGLQPKVVHWLYTAVVRPIVLYLCMVECTK